MLYAFTLFTLTHSCMYVPTFLFFFITEDANTCCYVPHFFVVDSQATAVRCITWRKGRGFLMAWLLMLKVTCGSPVTMQERSLGLTPLLVSNDYTRGHWSSWCSLNDEAPFLQLQDTLAPFTQLGHHWTASAHPVWFYRFCSLFIVLLNFLRCTTTDRLTPSVQTHFLLFWWSGLLWPLRNICSSWPEWIREQTSATGWTHF